MRHSESYVRGPAEGLSCLIFLMLCPTSFRPVSLTPNRTGYSARSSVRGEE